MPKSTTTREPTATRPATNGLAARLRELISAAFSAIWIQSHEPTEATRELTALCSAPGTATAG